MIESVFRMLIWGDAHSPTASSEVRPKMHRNPGALTVHIGPFLLSAFIFVVVLLYSIIMVGGVSMAATGPISITQDGARVVAPEVLCSGDPASSSSPITTGIAIRASNVTVVNPHVENCQRGVAIYRNSSGGVVENVRVIADASQPGYAKAELRHNRESLYIERMNGGEFGDITPSQLGADGGGLRINDTYRFMHALGSQGVTVHDFTGDCSGGANTNWGSGAPAGQCHWGIKWLSDRSTGAPYIVSGNTVKDVDIRGVDDESISVDGRFDVPARSAIVGTDTVASVSRDQITLNSTDWNNHGENLTNQFVQVVQGSEQGEYVRITARSGRTFTVADPDGLLSRIGQGTRVSVGMVYTDNAFNSNRVHSDSGKVHIDTHGVGSRTEIRNNVLTGTNVFDYIDAFHYRNNGQAPQCIDVRTASIGNSQVGGTKIGLSANNAVTGNSCAVGDLSLTDVAWATPPSGFVVGNYWADNTLNNGQAVTYLNNLLPSDPLGGKLPPPDADGDGVSDAEDNCPDEAGPATNGGCPLPVVGDSNEAEAMRLSNGATISEGADSVRFDANGERATWIDARATGTTSVVVVGRIGDDDTTRVCLNLAVNGRSVGNRCFNPGDTTYQPRTWANLRLAAGDDLSLESREIGNNEVLFMDKVAVV